MTVELFRFSGSPGAFHHADLLRGPDAVTVATVVAMDADLDALVLGSSQSLDLVDGRAARAEGLEVVKRRSGGGAVLVERDSMSWFDVVVPSGAPLAATIPDDVGRSMVWLGEVISDVLAALSVVSLTVFAGPMQRTPLSRLVCFAGIGPGEVSADGRKLVGISQRRQREGVRFQCMLHTRWNPERLLGVLVPPVPPLDELPPVATVTPDVAAALPSLLAARLTPS